ncbi:hypothetical protein [Ralstonia chuxiongensis]|uniref:Transmembrane protein n=1 Tax=Ralstonia chuxiongensis TaxID=2957504 RepID=A0AA41WVJ3_9RALS|nr:hypothetical protein [Ralstonia chuxiongensis]MCP1173604.1 hypothetical protein [Ralstonia chuxiongensis]
MVAGDTHRTDEKGREALHEDDRSHRTPLAQILMGVLAVTVFAAVMFDVLNADGYLGAWYTDVTGYKWTWSGRCLLLPCSHR